jgi:hypothetical protein
VPRSWLSGVVTEPLLQHLGKNVLVAARSSDNIDRNLHEVGIQSFIINPNVGPAFGQIGMLRRLVNCLTLLLALPCLSLQIRSLVLAAPCKEPCPERASVLRRLLRQRTTSQCWCQMWE